MAINFEKKTKIDIPVRAKLVPLSRMTRTYSILDFWKEAIFLLQIYRFSKTKVASLSPDWPPDLRVRVVHGKVWHDDGHGEGHGEHPAQGAQSAHEHAQVGLGHHVPVAHRRHRHQRPPQAQRDGVKVVVRIRLSGEEEDSLCEVHTRFHLIKNM